MKVFSSTLSLPILVVAIGASLTAGEAQAVPQTRTFYTNPVGICQAALPVFEGAIRKRPLAVQNEGTGNAFVTCSFTSQGEAITKVDVYFASNDGAAHNVSCTGVAGANDEFGVQSVVKAIALPGTGDKQVMSWLPNDFDDLIPGPPGPPPTQFQSPYFSISCNLVPGVGVNNSEMSFLEDVGA